MATFINADFNTVTVGVTSPFATGINVLPYKDHDASLNFRNTSDCVTLRDNIFCGSGRNAIFVFGHSNLRIVGNDITIFTTNRPFWVNAALYNISNGLSNGSASCNRRVVFNGFNGSGTIAPQLFNFDGNFLR